MKILRPIFLILLILLTGALSFLMYQTNNSRCALKEDVVELSNIRYGLFNMDEWKTVLADIITKKINEFELDGSNRAQMKTKISEFLYKVIGDLEERYYRENSSGIMGILKSGVAALTGTFEQIKKDVPVFTEQILDFLNNPANKKAVRAYLITKMNNYADSTFSKTDYARHDSIIAHYGFNNRPQTIQFLNGELTTIQTKADDFKIIFLVLAALTAAYMLVIKNLSKTEFLLLTSICFLFLLSGLTLPMIEIDARISELKMSLLGEDIVFSDQVLYYKSKSILQVVALMLSQSGTDVVLIGLLVLLFSVLFPLSKLMASVVLLFSPALSNNRFVSFLVYKTGKWSMADVMVVAIFMAYIGFSGILGEQLTQLKNISSTLDIITTNNSALQSGFFAFTAFALLSLLLAGRLKKMLKREDIARK
ncbi:MAG: paraquat-inducible protein A [Bacteroidia bacterium]|nr:paraquat-inducible protein A [Bacteroidia bacterium]